MELRYFWKQFDDEGRMTDKVFPWINDSQEVNTLKGFKTQEEAIEVMKKFCGEWWISPSAYNIILVQQIV